jgi:uncharacterized protein (TIGR02231 family)
MTPKFISTVFAISAATAIVPCSVLADHFQSQSIVTSATLYPSGAQIKREATIALPAGHHQVTFFDIPVGHESAVIQGLQTQISNATLGPIQVVNALATKDDGLVSEAAKAAFAKVETLEEQYKLEQRNVSKLKLEVSAAEDSLNYIAALQSPEGARSDEIAALALTIRTQSLEARLAMQNAQVRAQDAQDALRDLMQDLTDAQTELAKYVSSAEYRAQITLDMTLKTAADVDVSFVYDTDAAFWKPTYKAAVDTVEETLDLKRAVMAGQATGEPWEDVALRFASEQPSRWPAPSDVSEHVRRIGDIIAQREMRSVAFDGAAKTMAMEAPISSMDMEVAQAQSYGLNMTFDYASPATLYSTESGETEFALESISLTPDLMVRAVPLYDDTGFLIAKTKNESGEILLPGEMQLFRDGALIGQSYLDVQAAGAEFEVAFGAIDGIKISRTVLERNEGDRGFISKSNEAASSLRLDVENLTTRSWPIEVLDRVSVSEQEDLIVEWTADPMPAQQSYEDRRGVLNWQFDLPSGDTESITLTEKLRWPEGKTLR